MSIGDYMIYQGKPQTHQTNAKVAFTMLAISGIDVNTRSARKPKDDLTCKDYWP